MSSSVDCGAREASDSPFADCVERTFRAYNKCKTPGAFTKLEWDEAKAATNLRKHGVRFDAAMSFEFDAALIGIDDDLPYGEERLKAYGFIGTKLHVMIYVERGEAMRVISLRVASSLEKRVHEDEITYR